MDIKEIIREIKSKTDATGGLKAVYFIGCGGSQAAIYPGYYLIRNEANNIATALYTSNEFVFSPPKSLDNRCVCILCSRQATAETVEAVNVASSKGALTIAMTGFPDTEMAKVGLHRVVYSNGDNQIYSKANQALVLKIGFEILHQFENYQYYEQAMGVYGKIDKIIADAKDSLLPVAKEFAERYKNDELFYVLGSGPLFGTAYTMACCHFMEMQRNHAVCLNSGEYFHGPFETTGKKLPIILLKSIGTTRPMDERVEKFLHTYGGRHFILDAERTGLTAVDTHVVEYFNSVVMIPIERFFVSVLAETRGRSMDDRLYMYKVEY